jgi:hypothetical protein
MEMTTGTNSVTYHGDLDGNVRRAPDRGYWTDRRMRCESGGTSWIEMHRVFISPATFAGGEVDVQSDAPCPTGHADIQRIDNYGHPTESLLCYDCLGGAEELADIPECRMADCWCKAGE